jgi:hypothetical protein
MRRFLTLAVLAVVAFAGSGCSTVGFWYDDTANKIKVWRRDLHAAHRTIDRYFLNYDWEDPYL